MSETSDVDGAPGASDPAPVHLAELLVSLAVLGTLLGTTLTILREVHRAYALGAARVEAQQSARVALERLAADVRTAGAGAANPLLPALSVAETERIVLHSDVDGDGVIARRGETITWRLAGDILRRDAGGGAQPIVNGVRGLVLTYFDLADRPTTDPAEARSVGITLTTAPDHSASGAAAGLTVTMSTRVRVRNR